MPFAKLDSGIIHSSVWAQSKETRILWVTMLAMKDQNGFVWAALPGLARAANITLEECVDALKILEAPDPYSRTKSHDGIRVQSVEGGWFVINHEKYRAYNYSDNPEAARKREYRDKMGHSGTKWDNVPKRPGHSVSVSVSDSSSERGEVQERGPSLNSRLGEIINAGPEKWIWEDAAGHKSLTVLLASEPNVNVDDIIQAAKDYRRFCELQKTERRYITDLGNWIGNGKYKIDWKAKSEEAEKKWRKANTPSDIPGLI